MQFYCELTLHYSLSFTVYILHYTTFFVFIALQAAESSLHITLCKIHVVNFFLLFYCTIHTEQYILHAVQSIFYA